MNKDRQELVGTRVWRTADGDEIPYEKLEDRHLLNVLGHLRRRAIRDRLSVIYSLARYQPGGDGAGDACESAMDEFMREDHPDLPEHADLPPLEPEPGDEPDARPWERYASPEWAPLKEETRRRGLELPWTRKDDDMTRVELEGIK